MHTKGPPLFGRYWWMLFTLPLIPFFSYGQSDRDSIVADMHYHISMKGYNNHGLELLKDGQVNKKWIEEERHKGLKSRYNNYWVQAKATNSNLRNFTQATLPHTMKGKVRLAFNAITPFEYTLNDQYFDRLFSKFFKTGASLKWLKSIGDWDKLTHFESYQLELDMLNNQESKNRDWSFWKGDLDTMYTDTTYIVNVLEGAHALQHKWFNPELQFDPLNDEFEDRYIRVAAEDSTQRYLTAYGGAQDPSIKKSQLQKGIRNELEREVTKAKRMEQQGYNDPPKPIINRRERKIRMELDSTINLIKNNDPPVFMVTVGHLAFNGMIGHAPALDGNGVARVLLRKFFRTRVSNDQIWKKNWDDKFHAPPMPTEYGYYIIDKLLDKENGHRIFIDLKHSGFTTREWFYETIARRDTIPPICSHCAANGLSKIHYSVTTDEYAYADSKSVKNLYPISINLYDEEIATICELEGIIGITLEERVLGGYMKNPLRNDTLFKASSRKKEIHKKLKHLKQNHKLDKLIATVKTEAAQPPFNYKNLSDNQAYKIIYCDYMSLEPFMQNLFYIIDKSGKGRDAWKHLCIGSDLDGLMDPLDIIPTADQYPYFRKRLKQLAPIYLEFRDNNAQSWTNYYNDEADFDKKLNQLFYESLSNFVVKNFRK